MSNSAVTKTSSRIGRGCSATKAAVTSRATITDWLADQGMNHFRGAPRHPQTQGKVERWHQTLKNCVLLEKYYPPGPLEQAVADPIEHRNHRRYDESLANLTPADIYFGRAKTTRQRRKAIERKTIENRRLLHRQNAA